MQIISERYALVPDEAPRLGGMAEIHRAIDMKDGQKSVAIKLFRNNLDSDRLHLEAYSRECSALQRLDHPNIVRIFDGGRDPETNRRYIVLEWLDQSLSDHVTAHPVAGWDSYYADIGQPILAALAHAYGQDILHRDLKPQNILYSPEGVIKVADFGISKLRTFVAPGVTVAGFRSEPYSPPEPDNGYNSETRDVYGFAVLTLACVSGNLPVTYDDVYRALENFDAPPDVVKIFEKALSRDPQARHQNIIELRRELDSVQGDRESYFASNSDRRRCYIKIMPKVVEKLQSALDHAAIDAREFVLNDLNEICGIKLHDSSDGQKGIHLALYAAQYLYHAGVDPKSRSYLVIHNVFPFQPSYLEFQRETAWTPSLAYAQLLGPPPAESSQTIEWLVQGVAEHGCSIAEQHRAAQADGVFRTWISILQAKSEVEQHREAPIPYESYEHLGNRLKLFTSHPLDDDLVGQPRLIEITDHQVIAGEVESVEADHIVLWSEEEITDAVPTRGKLQFDTRAGRFAINRQRQAVDAVRFRRGVRPDLRDILLEPEKARPPVDPGHIEFIADHLDTSKQEALRKALGTESFLVVEGPPGTGKTRFITELVLQTLLRTPRARILLTSQTHVALDNALEQIRRLKPELKLVRIGHRHDERISKEVSDLLLENRVDAWLKQVRQRSEEFLAAHAAALGVDRSEIALGMAAAGLRAALEQLDVFEKQRAEAAAILDKLSQAEAERAATDRSDTYHELKETLRDSSETKTRLDLEIKLARKRVDQARKSLAQLPDLGAGLANLSAPELQEWEAAFLEHNEKTRHVHRLITLAEEWYLRFGRSRDFFAALIADSEVIAGTCLGFTGIRGMQNVDFDLCIVDEASKASVTELLVPLSRSRKWILVGDRNQLPPFVEDALEDRSLLKSHGLTPDDLRMTLLEILADRLPKEAVTRLLHQHRMIRQIGDLVSHCFYDDELQSVNDGDSAALAPAMPRPVMWFSTTLLPNRRERRDHQSFKNLAEVRQVCRILQHLNLMARLRDTKYKVAVLTGYASQREELRRALDADHLTLDRVEIECNTVDAFQGREADIVIYSVTRCNESGDLGFLRERRRLNVALSRARMGLAIVGDAGFVRSAMGFNPWHKVIDYIETHPDDCAIQEVSV